MPKLFALNASTLINFSLFFAIVFVRKAFAQNEQIVILEGEQQPALGYVIEGVDLEAFSESSFEFDIKPDVVGTDPNVLYGVFESLYTVLLSQDLQLLVRLYFYDGDQWLDTQTFYGGTLVVDEYTHVAIALSNTQRTLTIVLNESTVYYYYLRSEHTPSTDQENVFMFTRTNEEPAPVTVQGLSYFNYLLEVPDDATTVPREEIGLEDATKDTPDADQSDDDDDDDATSDDSDWYVTAALISLGMSGIFIFGVRRRSDIDEEEQRQATLSKALGDVSNLGPSGGSPSSSSGRVRSVVFAESRWVNTMPQESPPNGVPDSSWAVSESLSIAPNPRERYPVEKTD